MQNSSTPAPEATGSTVEEKSPSEFDTDNHHKVHYYNDGNILLNLQGKLFRVHKSVLSLHSRTFSDMFSLALSPNDTQDVDEVPLHDEPLKFARVLDALYKGMTFILVVTLRNCLDIIEIAHKYEMTQVEACFQGWLLGKLPLSASDALTTPKYFSRYRNDPSLAPSVLEYGDPRLHPWAFYCLGVQLMSELDPTNTSTYSTPLSLSTLDSTYTYPLFILQQIISQAFLEWNNRISEFYAVDCPKSLHCDSDGPGKPECSRESMAFTTATSPLKLSSKAKHKDPVQLLVPHIDTLREALSSHGGVYCNWCSSCTESLLFAAEDVVRSIHPRLLECVSLLRKSRVPAKTIS
ncbi:hypothetical protein FRC08_002586 [Ceratobasidium sp. 394]|nr:hypothetical protein FRC08_002586 [Ceratobasidium sp. 394]KAG9094168.1 hypothetical protein FS749_013006 [Ceratobasidium sp. UAMH 11750]